MDEKVSGLIDRILATLTVIPPLPVKPPNGSHDGNVSVPETTTSESLKISEALETLSPSNPQPSCSSDQMTGPFDGLSRLSNLQNTKLQNDVLAQCISNNPALWDSTDPQFTNQKYRNLLWSSIANVLQLDVKKVKARWAALKKNYKNTYEKSTSGSTKAPILDQLRFMEEEIKRTLKREASERLKARAQMETRPTNGIDYVTIVADDSDIEEIVEDDDDCRIISVTPGREKTLPMVNKKERTKEKLEALASTTSAPQCFVKLELSAESNTLISAPVRLRRISDLMEKTLEPNSSSASADAPQPGSVPLKKRTLKNPSNPIYLKRKSPDVIFIEEKIRRPKCPKESVTLSSCSDGAETVGDKMEIEQDQDASSGLPTAADSSASVKSSCADMTSPTFQLAPEIRLSLTAADSSTSVNSSRTDRTSPTVRPTPEISRTERQGVSLTAVGTSISVKCPRADGTTPVVRRTTDPDRVEWRTRSSSLSVESTRTDVTSPTARRASEVIRVVRQTTSGSEAVADPSGSVMSPQSKIATARKSTSRASAGMLTPQERQPENDHTDEKIDVHLIIPRDVSANEAFLSSLLPDVETMTNAQFRVLKKHSTALMCALLNTEK